jgi:hypothetical protein
MLPPIDSLKPLGGPFEILELRDQQRLEIAPTHMEFGTMTIKTGDAPEGKVIVVARLHVQIRRFGLTPAYWDVTGQHAVAELYGWHMATGGVHGTFRLTQYGKGKAGRTQIDHRPRVA